MLTLIPHFCPGEHSVEARQHAQRLAQLPLPLRPPGWAAPASAAEPREGAGGVAAAVAQAAELPPDLPWLPTVRWRGGTRGPLMQLQSNIGARQQVGWEGASGGVAATGVALPAWRTCVRQHHQES